VDEAGAFATVLEGTYNEDMKVIQSVNEHYTYMVAMNGLAVFNCKFAVGGI
jgi:hypothetical protein